MLGVILGLLYVNFIEWFAHNHILHGWGKRKDSFWFFHIQHHKDSIKNNFADEPSWQEAMLILFMAFLHLPIAYYWLEFYIGASIGGVLYYTLHRLSHSYPKAANKYLPWHYDHHMVDPSSNWCVTYPFWDIVMGTYVRRNPKTELPQEINS